MDKSHKFIIIKPAVAIMCLLEIYIKKCITFQTLYTYADKKNQLGVTFCILYFSSNSCSTCFGQHCAHHQELTTA